MPKDILSHVTAIKDDDAAIQAYGVQLAVDLCRELFDSGLVRKGGGVKGQVYVQQRACDMFT